MAVLRTCSSNNFPVGHTTALTIIIMSHIASRVVSSLTKCVPLITFLQLPLPTPPLIITNPISFSMSLVFFCFLLFVILDYTYKWHHTVFVFLWLISLSIMPSKSIHVVTNDRISSLIMAELHICLCVYACVYVYVCAHMYTYYYIYTTTFLSIHLLIMA